MITQNATPRKDDNLRNGVLTTRILNKGIWLCLVAVSVAHLSL